MRYNNMWRYLILSYVLHIKLCDGFLFGKKSTSITVPPTTATVNITLAAPDQDFNLVDYEIGAILGVVFGVLVSAIVISVAGIAYIRRKRERDREYQRQAHVMKESAKSAGVYGETTTEDRLVAESYRESSKDYRTLYKNPNLYETDSEDEL